MLKRVFLARHLLSVPTIKGLSVDLNLGYTTLPFCFPSFCCKMRKCMSTMENNAAAPTQTASSQEYKSTLTLDLINHLERTSLVEFGSEEALTRLTEAIEFANVLFEVDTAGVEPMTSILDESSLRLRDDTVVETLREDILANASITDEDYFVSPPGNIPLTPKTAIDLPPPVQNQSSRSSN